MEWLKKRHAVKALRSLNKSQTGDYATAIDECSEEQDEQDEEAEKEEQRDPHRLHQCGRCLQLVPAGHNAGSCEYGSPLPAKPKKPRTSKDDL